MMRSNCFHGHLNFTAQRVLIEANAFLPCCLPFRSRLRSLLSLDLSGGPALTIPIHCNAFYVEPRRFEVDRNHFDEPELDAAADRAVFRPGATPSRQLQLHRFA